MLDYEVDGNSVRNWCKNLGIDSKQYSARVNDEFVENICPYCGKVVRSTKQKNKKFCNIDCYNSYYCMDENLVIELFKKDYSLRRISEEMKVDRKKITKFLRNTGYLK